jgi:DNA-binding CsgD family transcriptional regulator
MDLRCGHTPTFVDAPRLSDRETQILDGLVKGYANKVIARRCDITEATVKVHMKSILRKIRVGNRTQAAIWAFEHGYCNEVAKPTEVKDGGVEGVLNGFTVASGEKRPVNVQE